MTVEQAEELIYEYIYLHWEVRQGWKPKIGYFLKKKAAEFGVGQTTAWKLIRYARSVGMVQLPRNLNWF